MSQDNEREMVDTAIDYLDELIISNLHRTDVQRVLKWVIGRLNRSVESEASDAQVLAALNAEYRERITRSSPYVPENWGDHPGEWSEADKRAMRAALRAAEAGGER